MTDTPPPARPIPWPIAPLFAAPALALLLFMLLPLAVLAVTTPPAALWRTLVDAEVLDAFALTATAALAATAVALLGGVPLAYLLARSRHPLASAVTALVDLPLVLPHTAAGIALLLAYAREAAAGSLLAHLGIPFVSHPVGIAAAMTFVSAPYLVAAAREGFARQDARLEPLARTLGAGPWQAFRYVALPLAARSIATGAVQMWARGISEFGAIMIIAYHPRVLPVLLWDRFQTGGLEAARPIAALLLLMSAAVLLALRWLARTLPEARTAR